MKTKIISKLKKGVLIIEMPEEWTFNIYKDQIGFCNEINKPIEQIKGSYTLLGSPDEIKEEDAADIVHLLGDKSYTWTNYEKQFYGFDNAIESFNSALESEILWSNPFGEEPRSYSEVMDGVSNDEIYEDVKDWHEAQEKTFDKKRTLIFVKN